MTVGGAGIGRAFVLDATDWAEVGTVIAAAAEALGGPIDPLVNNAGGLIGRQTLTEMTDEHWFAVIDVNVMSTTPRAPLSRGLKLADPDAGAVERPEVSRRRVARRGGAPLFDSPQRSLISGFERRKSSVRTTLLVIDALLLMVLVRAGLGPIVWLAKSAITPTQDTLRTPMEFLPGRTAWDDLWKGWVRVKTSA